MNEHPINHDTLVSSDLPPAGATEVVLLQGRVNKPGAGKRGAGGVYIISGRGRGSFLERG